MRRSTWFGLIGMALFALPDDVEAQGLVPLRRNMLGFGVAFMQPTGEFEQFVSWGGGANLNFVAGLDRAGILGIRLDGSILWYGHENYDVWMGPRVPYGYFRVNTDNLIGSFGIGPQLTLGTGPIRPYAFGLVGMSYFATTSSVEGAYGETYDSALNYEDATLGVGAGGGLLMQLGGRRHPVYLDVGAHWTHNGRTTYLREGSIVEYPDGSAVIYPILSDADHWTFRLGVGFGI
jgi:hypothetical protein